MTRILGFLTIALAFGALLAGVAIYGHVTTGWVGALALIGWAILARRRWEKMRATSGIDPGGPERVIWHRFAGTGMLFGHSAFTLLNPGINVRLGSGNTLAIDSWLMLIALLASAVVFRGDARDRDERDRAIASRGVNAGYGALIILIIVLMLFLGFAPDALRQPLTHWNLANLMSALIVASLLVMQSAQLLFYARDNDAAKRERTTT
jgi:hypothetical protein